MREGGWILLVAALLLAALTALAAEPRLKDGGQAVVAKVTDERTLSLTDGRVVRLAGIGSLVDEPARPGIRLTTFAATSKDVLSKLVLGRTVQLKLSERPIDRYGRVVAQVFVSGDTWVQGELVRLGLARVESSADSRGMIVSMQEIEDIARVAKLGIWSDNRYAVRTAEETEQHLNRFEIVEGRVAAADQVNGRVYLNFGPDWRTDFTVSIAPADARAFKREGVDLLAMEGKRIRVRGWLRSYNGPVIDVTHPEQIELLDK